MRQTAIYTKSDGMVDWQVCPDGRPRGGRRGFGHTFGLAFNPAVYDVLARRLAAAQETQTVRTRTCA